MLGSLLLFIFRQIRASKGVGWWMLGLLKQEDLIASHQLGNKLWGCSDHIWIISDSWDLDAVCHITCKLQETCVEEAIFRILQGA